MKEEKEKLSPYDFYQNQLADIRRRLRQGDIVQCKEFDPVIEYAKDRRCLSCGKLPDDNFMTAYECKACGMTRKGEDYYNDIIKKKKQSEDYWMNRDRLKKRFNVDIEEDEEDDLPF